MEHVYEARHVQIQSNTNVVPVSRSVGKDSDEAPVPDMVPVHVASAEAAVNRSYQRRVKYPAEMESQIARELDLLHCAIIRHFQEWGRLQQSFDEQMTMEAGTLEANILIDRVIREALKNAFWHGHRVDPRLPIGFSWRIGSETRPQPLVYAMDDDRIEIAVSDHGSGVDLNALPGPLEVFDSGQEGGLGVVSLIGGTCHSVANDVERVDIEGFVVTRHTMRMSRYLFHDALKRRK